MEESEELLGARIYAHKRFDLLWKKKYMTRSNAYAWLARRLNIPSDECHISQFDEELCTKTVAVTNQELNRIKRYKKRKNKN